MKVKVCLSCGFENDNTRVFCTNCGVRLPDSLTDSKQRNQQTIPGSAGQSAPSLPSSGSGKAKVKPHNIKQPSVIGALFGQIVFTAATGALVAALIQMARVPDGIPAAVAPNPAAAQRTIEALQHSANSPTPLAWIANTNSVNEFLASTIQMQSTGQSSAFRAEFQRAFVTLQEGAFDYGIEQRFLTINFYFRLHAVPQSDSTGMRASIVGASIGRLPIHPQLVSLIMPIFKPSLEGLNQATVILQRASTATISPTNVMIKWPASSATR